MGSTPSPVIKGSIVNDLDQLIAAGKRYQVIYADPPWSFATYSEKGKGRSAERHYRVSSLEQIRALPVEQLAADDCMLLLWSTWPHLLQAIGLIEAWGFTYKTDGFLWVKQSLESDKLHWGMGYWTRANTEPCLLATRGRPKRLSGGVHQVVVANRTRHSEKPFAVYGRIERLIAGPYLELYARRAVPGWDCWGDEVTA